MDSKPRRPIVGYAIAPKGVEFRCGRCEYFAGGKCHLPLPEMHMREVDAQRGCCDYFEHPGMKIIVK